MQAKSLKILGRKDVKKMESSLGKELRGFLFLESNGKIWITSREMEGVDFENLRPNYIGLFFGEMKSGKLVLSKEAEQII